MDRLVWVGLLCLSICTDINGDTHTHQNTNKQTNTNKPTQIISMDYRSPELEQKTRTRIATLTATWAAAHAPDEGEGEMKDERVANGEEGDGDGGLGVGPGWDAGGGIKASWMDQFAKVGFSGVGVKTRTTIIHVRI